MEQEDLVRAVNKIHASAELRAKAISGQPAPHRRKPAYAPLFKGAACLAAVAVIAVGIFAVPKILKPVVAVTPASQGSSTAGTDSKANVTNGLYQDSEIQNILVLGLDGQKGETTRSDSMMILSIDKRHSKLKVTSLLRDMYIKIPGNEDNRLNAAYSLGGAPLAVKTVENNFGFRIDNYVTVDYGAFEKIIDRVGGVTIGVTEPEVKLINRYSGESADKKVTAGNVVLTGKQALYYSRIRVIDTDFGRTERQRKVVISILNKLKSSDAATVLSVVTDIFPSVKTDMKKDDAFGLAKDSLTFLKYPVLQSRLPADGTYKEETVREMDVLVPDMQANKQAAMKFIYDVNIEFPVQSQNSSSGSADASQKPEYTDSESIAQK